MLVAASVLLLGQSTTEVGRDAPVAFHERQLAGRDAGLKFHVNERIGRNAPVKWHVLVNVAISGTVTLSGNPIENATVRLYNMTTTSHHGNTTTNASGIYNFPDLNSGHVYHAFVEYESGGIKYHAFSQPFLVPS